MNLVRQPQKIMADRNLLTTSVNPDFSSAQIEAGLLNFLGALRKQNFSSATIRNYRSDIRQFYKFLEVSELEKLFARETLRNFVLSQRTKGLKDSSITRKIASITQFALWSKDQGLIDSDLSWMGHTTVESLVKPTPQPSAARPKVSGWFNFLHRKKAAPVEKPVVAPVVPVTAPTPPVAPIPQAKPATPAKQVPQAQSVTKSDQIKTNVNRPITDTRLINQFSTQARPVTKPRLRSSSALILPYLNLFLMVLAFIGLGFLGYNQLVTRAPITQAFPSNPVRAARVLSYQGRLTDTAQNPITVATNMEFKIWSVLSGGTEGSCDGSTQCEYKTGTCSVTPDQDGIFNVGIGGTCGTEIGNAVFTENAAVWLEVKISTETLTPRQPIYTVPYAINSETVQGYPISASQAATANTILVMDAGGNITLGEVGPKLTSVAGTFRISGATLSLVSTGDLLFTDARATNIPLTVSDSTINAALGQGIIDAINDAYSAAIGGGGGTWTLTDNLLYPTQYWANDVSIGGNSTTSAHIWFGHTGGAIFNEQSNDVDFRIESDTNANAFFLDGTNGNIGIGTSTPQNILHLNDASAAYSNLTSSTNLIITTTDAQAIDKGGTIGLGGYIDDAASTQRLFGVITGRKESSSTGAQSGYLSLATNNAGTMTEWMRISSAGNVGIGDTSPDAKLNILSTTEQLRLDYDDSNYASFTISSAGDLTIAPTGGDLAVTGNLDASGTFAAGTANALTIDASGNLVTTGTLTAATDETINGIDINAGAVSDITSLSASSTITFSTFTTNGGLLYTNGSGVLGQTAAGNLNECLLSAGGGTPTWGSCAAAAANNFWRISSGAISPYNDTLDLLVGASATASAKFAFINVNSGTPTASISSTIANVSTYLTGDGTLGATNRHNITIGNSSTYDTTGNVLINSNGTGRVGIGTTAPTRAFQVNVASDVIALFKNTAAGSNAYSLLDIEQNSGTDTIAAIRTRNDVATWTFGIDGATDDQFAISNSDSISFAATKLSILTNGNVGINDLSPDAKLNILSTTEQLRLDYNDSNYTSFTTSSGGDLTINPTGGDTSINGTLSITSIPAGATDTVLTHSGGAVQQRTIDSRVWGSTLTDGSGIASYVARWTDANTLSTGVLYDNATNVGISTITPHAKLTVNGDLYANAATVSATYAGGTAMTLRGGPSGTANILNLTDDGGNSLAYFGPETGDSGLLRIQYGGGGNSYIEASSTFGSPKLMLDRGSTANDSLIQFLTAGSPQWYIGSPGAAADDDLVIGNPTTAIMTIEDAGVANSLVIESTGNLTFGQAFNAGGLSGVSYNAISDSGTATFASTDDDLFIEDILEVGGSLYVGGMPVSANSLWTNTLNVYHPSGSYAGVADLALGGTSTASAKFAVININSGTPTASISANVANVATYLTGDGTLATTNRNTLTIGNSSTYDTSGNLLIHPNGTGSVGIGVTDPSTVKLNVTRANDSGVILRLGSSSLSTHSFDFSRNGGTGALSIQGNQTGFNNIVLAPTSGTVGIGTAAPSTVYKLVADNTQTNPTTTVRGIHGSATITATSDNANGVIGVLGTATSNTGAAINNTATSYAGYFQAIKAGAGNVTSTLIGVNALVDNNSGGGTLTAARGLNVSVNQTSGTVTTGYGVFISDIVATTDYGIYQNGANDTNYFAGDIGIGTTAPVSKLHLTGAVTGKALAIFDETGDQDIFAASASGAVVARISRTGHMIANRFADLANESYFLDPAATDISLTVAGKVGIGTSAPAHYLQTTGAITGKALAVLNETGDQSIVVASSSGTRVFEVGHEGDVTVGNVSKNDVDINLYGDLFQQEGSNLNAIANITDVFVYDTTKDSDKGAWTNSLTARSLSWYTETKDDGPADTCVVASDDRCGRSAFPKKAIVVTTTTAVYIFDAQDNSLWMKFTQAGTYQLGADTNNNPSSVFALNGSMYVGMNGSSSIGLVEIDFKNDRTFTYDTTDRAQGDTTIGNRNTTTAYATNTNTNFAILNNYINDISANVISGKTYIALASGANTGADDTEGITLIHKTDAKTTYFVRDSQGANDLRLKRVWLTSEGTLYSIHHNASTTGDSLSIYYNIQNDASETSSVEHRDATTSSISTSNMALAPTTTESANSLFVTERTSTNDGASDTIYEGSAGGMTIIQNRRGDEANGSAKFYTTSYITEDMLGDIRNMNPMNGTGETSANTTLTSFDASVKANAFTTDEAGTTPNFVSGVRGTALEFDGGDYVCTGTAGTCADDADLDFAAATNFTVEAWFKHSSSTVRRVILSKRDTSGSVASNPSGSQVSAIGYSLYFGSNNDAGSTNALPCFGIDDDATTFPEDSACGTTRVDDGNWHHLVGIKTGTSRLDLYLDGQLVGSDTSIAATGTLANAGEFVIGEEKIGVTHANQFNGQIDETTVTAEVLTADQIRTMYLSGKQAANKRWANVTDATTATSTTLGDSGETWIPNEFVGQVVELTGGTGSGQTRTVISNTTTVLTVSPAFGTTPDTTTDFKIDPERLYGATNTVTAVSVTDGNLGSDRVLYVGTSDGSDGGGVTAFDHDGDYMTDVYHAAAGKTDENSTAWGATTDYDDIAALDTRSDVVGIGSLGHYWHERKEKTFTQVVDELRNSVMGLIGGTGGGLTGQTPLTTHVQNDTTNTSQGYQVIRKGWGYIAGAAATSISESVSFGITFDETPVIFTQYIGHTTATPTSPSHCNAGLSFITSAVFASTQTSYTNYMLSTNASTNLSAGINYCYTWLAIGKYQAGYSSGASPWAAGADLAEWYSTPDKTLQAGEVVSINQDGNISVVRSGQPYDAKAIGIIATQPALTIGPESGLTPGYKPQSIASDSASVAVALAGRVPVKVSLENGVIEPGDALTTASTPGYAMKATQPGPIIGKAMERFDGTTTIAALGIEGAEVASDSAQLTAEDFKDLSAGLGTIMAFVNVSYADPTQGEVADASTYASDTGGKYALDSRGKLVGLGSYEFETVDEWQSLVNGTFIDRLTETLLPTPTPVSTTSGQVATLTRQSVLDAALARLSNLGTLALSQLNVARVRVMETLFARQIEAEKVVAEKVETNLITPIGESDLTVKLGQTASDSTKLSIINGAEVEVATIDNHGNASFSGQITAESSRLQQLETRMAEVEHLKAQTAAIVTATISGTLYADDIYNFDQKVATTLTKPSFLAALLGTDPSATVSGSFVSADQLAAQAGYDPTPTASSAAALNQTLADLELLTADESTLVLDSVFIDHFFKVNGSGYISDSLKIKNSLWVGSGMRISDGAIEYNLSEDQLVNNEKPILELQPSGTGSISLLAGLMTLSDNGQVHVTGDLTVAGNLKVEKTLLTNLLAPADFAQPLQVQVASTSATGEVLSSRFEIVGEMGAPVATISARGRAQFDGGLGVGAEDLSTATSAEVSTQKTSGKATVQAYQSQVIIRTNQVQKDSLIYVTPIGSTQNQVLFVKGQNMDDSQTPENEGHFVVGFDTPIDQAVSFNWWIVN